jgi:HSP20 family protein
MMNLIARNPFALINELQRDMSRFFPAVADDAAVNSSDWLPAVDIHEDRDSYQLLVDLPGISADNIAVTAHNGVLSISGKREAVQRDKERKRAERVFGSFLREFRMPENADLDNVQAKSKDGVLEVVVPKIPKAEPKRITVQ